MAKISGVSAFPDGDNIFNWIGTIQGPVGTPYEGCTYRIKMAFPADYPFTAPAIYFETPIFHPNVCPKGSICLDILKVQSNINDVHPLGQMVSRVQCADHSDITAESSGRYI